MPDIESTSQERNATVLKSIEALLLKIDTHTDVLTETNERIQQQLAQINNNNNLEPGDTHYG